ncbi:hypothetical protein JCM19274_2308 [Algibacter lectus]|uniref:Uncharacterized protein n=1 Tax=Algibacter lectus TaxID=221126 RepID=A0A090X2G4_9FLAO|nr:hypothetical protein JCM19274_2308 [Algibacter lectus]
MSSFCVVAPMQHKKASSESPTLAIPLEGVARVTPKQQPNSTNLFFFHSFSLKLKF